MRLTKIVGLATVGVLSLAACGGSPADNATDKKSAGPGDKIAPDASGFAPDAKGPAPAIAGAKKGGTLIFSSAGAPSTFDPSAQFYQDVQPVMKLTNRTLTVSRVENGKSVLVPDLATDLGKASADGLTWTFTLKDGIKYEDGSPVVAGDIAYAVKRSFAQEELPGGPTYQLNYLKDGGKYKGPYKDGETFAGIEAPNPKTVVFHLSTKWPTLPYFASFSQVSPIPKAKDTKDRYTEHPLATGPYMFKKYVQGQELVLVKNPNWDPNSDAARYQFPDQIEFHYNQDLVKAQQSIVASNGPDANTLNYDGVDASILPAVTGASKSQLVTGPEPCATYTSLDTRKIPFEVRKAVAAAYPYDQIRLATGVTPLSYSPASTYMAPQVPGFTSTPTEGLTGQGKGDPVKAKEMLKAAGKEKFELSWYFSSDNPLSVKANIVRKQGFQAAGFTVKDIGVPVKQRRLKVADPKAPVNMLQGPAGWCFDWPQGDGVYPAVFKSNTLNTGQSTGFLNDKSLDAEMDRISALPADKQGAQWGKFDKNLREKYLPAIPTELGKANFVFGKNVKHVVDDSGLGMPEMASIWLDNQ